MNLTEVKTIMLPWPQVSDILSELCRLITLPDEGGSTVDGFGMRFCEHLIFHQLGLGWKYRVIGEDGLWLVDVKVKQQPEPAIAELEKMLKEEAKNGQ